LAGAVYVGVHLLLITGVHWQFWTPTSPVPYFFAVFIIMSSMFINLYASFWTWLASAILTVTVLPFVEAVEFTQGLPILLPIAFNLIVASISFLSAIDWQIALESTSELHLKVQQRRDELFNIQEELSLTNAKLHSLNRELEKAKRAAEAERDKRTRFMNNVSHELRTPLNAIVNFAYILEQGGRGEVSEAQADYLKRIEQSGNYLLNVLNDLLDLARIESGEFQLHPELTNLHEICEEAMSNTRGLILDKDIQLIRDYPMDWPTVFVDKMRIKQSLINMLGNAAKYTESGHITLHIRTEDETLFLAVEDTGVGIASEHHQAIFQEFRQVDDTAARKRIGTGLGLPIARHLIERHEGTLSVVSRLGQGSTFTIALPIARQESESLVEELVVEPVAL
jgi:signal transduction histidine kinase